MTTRGQRVVLARRPSGVLADDVARLEDFEVPRPGPGQIVVRTTHVSVDPYMRLKMNEGPSYTPPYNLGEPLGGRGVGIVEQTRDSRWQVGDRVVAGTLWQTHAVIEGASARAAPEGPTPAVLLGVLGMPGFTAYSGLHVIGRPRAGETVVVAAASGPVGATVAQLARIAGAKVVCIVGGPQKVGHVTTALGIDCVLDRTSATFVDDLARAVPDGIDVYFENVGGAVLDAVRPLLNVGARIPLCGIVADYDLFDQDDAGGSRPGPDRLPGLWRQILVKSLRVRGFIATEFVDDHYDEFEQQMIEWLRQGRVAHLEDVTVGLDRALSVLREVVAGLNHGKAVIQVGPSGDPQPSP